MRRAAAPKWRNQFNGSPLTGKTAQRIYHNNWNLVWGNKSTIRQITAKRSNVGEFKLNSGYKPTFCNRWCWNQKCKYIYTCLQNFWMQENPKHSANQRIKWKTRSFFRSIPREWPAGNIVVLWGPKLLNIARKKWGEVLGSDRDCDWIFHLADR